MTPACQVHPGLTPATCVARVRACVIAIAASPLTHYVIVRADLEPGFLAAQIVHAAGESSPGGLPEGTFAVVLAVPSETALAELGRQLVDAGIAHVAIREPDAPHLGALTAIGCVPVADRAAIRRLTSSLPLYGQRAPAPARARCGDREASPCNGGRRQEAKAM